ncbi:hypothetical protein [Marinicella litoralis]|uniref:Uncharacterized protein n=1 Tax=Marinicella litoralis TaxID=644220 RepID=A0A4R6XZ32_9GAMM|nr:hypothetical protein [Marinicella litoralis]TDR23899.1 hypothetical protein C8D91_0767 [Marinicella litoralis]
MQETRSLVMDIAPDVKLWRWLGSGSLELVFDVGSGYITSYQSDDVGYFANVLFINGHFKDHATALKKINQGGLS